MANATNNPTPSQTSLTDSETNHTPSKTSLTKSQISFTPGKAPLDVLAQIAMEIAAAVVKKAIRKAVKEVDLKERFPQPSERLQRIAEPSMTSYVSLYNNYRNVLEPEKVLRIEERMADIRKYSHVISDDLKILIVDRVRGITQQQVNLLQIKIMESLENYVNSNPKQIPRFLENAYAFKCLKIVCADQFTVNWLRKLIANLSPPPWKGARLEVTLMSSYSISSTIPKQRRNNSNPKEGRVKFYIPKTDKKLDFAELSKHIQTRNPPIKTDSWKKLKEDSTKHGTLYYVSMCNDSIELIRTNGNRLFYLLGSIQVTILDENEVIPCKKHSSKNRHAKNDYSKKNLTPSPSRIYNQNQDQNAINP